VHAKQQQQPWVPLSVNLGVPLFCPSLCQLVCDNMTHHQCLTPTGEAAWRNAQQQLQQQLSEQVGLADSSSSGGDRGAEGSKGGSSGVVQGGPLGHALAGGGGVRLPSHSLLFDGHSLLPVDVSTCLQGAQLW
jgi:hypothetical protein